MDRGGREISYLIVYVDIRHFLLFSYYLVLCISICEMLIDLYRFENNQDICYGLTFRDVIEKRIELLV